MKYANKIGAAYSVIFGDNEIDNDLVKLKNMETGEETPTELDAKKICEVIKN